MSFQIKYNGRTSTGAVNYEVVVKCEEGIAILRDMTAPELLSGREFPTNFVPYNQPTRTGPSASRLRQSATRQERRTAEALGGHRQTGSGSKHGYKGDGRVEGKYRIESKFTQADSFRVSLSDLSKIRSECSNTEVPIFEVEFREKGTLRTKDKWALIPWATLEKLVNAAIDDK